VLANKREERREKEELVGVKNRAGRPSDDELKAGSASYGCRFCSSDSSQVLL